MSHPCRSAIFVLAAALLGACAAAHAGEATLQGSALKVIGASLEDSGTFGFKFTVQSAQGKPYKTYVEQIAASRGLPDLCNHYTLDAAAGTPTGPIQSACTNYAVGGAQIHNFVPQSATVDDTNASSLIKQMGDLGSAGFSRNDLVIIGEAVGNDAQALLNAAGTIGTSGTAGFVAYIDSLLGPNVAEKLIAKAASAKRGDPSLGIAIAGARFMTALADKLMASVHANLISKGAHRVAIVNALDIIKTPVFQYNLSTLSPTDRASTRVLAEAWILAYNIELSRKAAQASGKVVVIDFHRGFNFEYSHPQLFGLTNVDSTVCTQTYQHAVNGTASLATAGTDALDAPEVLQTCNDQTASSITPTENATGPQWWTSYLFADNFHPTPHGHQLLAQSVTMRLSHVGWR